MKLKDPCKICHSVNWCGRQCVHAPKAVILPVVPVPRPQVKAQKVQVEVKKRQVGSPEKPPFNKKEYQRNYMRDRMRRKRAEDKAAKEVKP